MRASRVVSLFLLLGSWGPVKAQTAQYLQAPVLAPDTDLVVAISPDNKSLFYRRSSNGSLQPLPTDQLLVHNPFRIAVLRYNPLAMKVSVNAVDVDDPAQAALQKLLDSLQSVGTTLTSSGTKASAEMKSASVALDAAKKSNDAAAATAAENAQTAATQVQQAIDKANQALAQLRTDIPQWSQAIDDTWAPGKTEKEALAAGVSAIKSSQVKLTNASVDLKGFGDTLNSITPVDAHIVRLVEAFDSVSKAMDDTSNALQRLIAPLTEQEAIRLWDSTGTAFITGGVIDPSQAKEKKVTITVTFVSIDTSTYALKDAGSPLAATFTARKYRALLPEVGAGAVFSFIDRPNYGTGKNANGQTVVALSSTDHVSIAPTVMLNFVCRCDAGGIAPMAQIGAAVSTSLPAVLLGGGLRLFTVGKGDLAIGGGLTLGWYKGLNKLHVGDVVAGTADINADLGFIGEPKPAPYMTIQYKF